MRQWRNKFKSELSWCDELTWTKGEICAPKAILCGVKRFGCARLR
jgi:hypothetical protein